MSTSPSNLFLSSLSSKSREYLLARSTAVALPLRTVLYTADKLPAHAYFVTSGIASVVTTMPEGKTAEVGVIGREGVVGSLHLLGSAKVPTDCFTQMAGTALRIPLPELRKAFRNSEEIRERILQFVQEQALSLGQLAACHRLHEAEQRLARWLLMVQDRVQSDVLKITQEFLAQMLGSQRTTVTVAARALQKGGSIEYRHGQVTILDRKKLEAAACGCYQVTKRGFNNLYR